MCQQLPASMVQQPGISARSERAHIKTALCLQFLFFFAFFFLNPQKNSLKNIHLDTSLQPTSVYLTMRGYPSQENEVLFFLFIFPPPCEMMNGARRPSRVEGAKSQRDRSFSTHFCGTSLHSRLISSPAGYLSSGLRARRIRRRPLQTQRRGWIALPILINVYSTHFSSQFTSPFTRPGQ